MLLQYLEQKMKKFICVAAIGCGMCGVAGAEGLDSSVIGRIADSTQPLPWAVTTGFESWHTGHHPDLNEHNPGVGIRAPGGWTVGTYYNSYRRHSVYAGREFQWRLLGEGETGLNVGAVAGALSGYTGGLNGGAEHGIHLMVLPEAVVVSRYAELAVIFIPKATKNPQTIAVQLRLRWP